MNEQPCVLAAALDPRLQALIERAPTTEDSVFISDDDTCHDEYDPLDRLAATANSEHAVAVGSFARHAVLAGLALIDAKKIVKQKRGSWREWIAQNCTFSERKAQIYMKLARDPQRAADFDSIREALRGGGPYGGLTGNEEAFTPADIIKAVHAVLGGLDLDPASCAEANATVRARRYFTKADDALTQDWVAPTLFMNPPYTRGTVTSFCEKLVGHVKAGDVPSAIALVSNDTSTNWFVTLQSAASAVCFYTGHVSFVRPGFKTSKAMLGTAIFYFGSDREVFRREFEPVGPVLYPAGRCA